MPGSSPHGSPKLPELSPDPRAQRAGVQLVVASVFFGLMAVGTKALAGTMPGPQVAFLRMVFGVLLFAGLALRQPEIVRVRRPGWLAARGLFGGAAVLLYFVSIERVGVGLATLVHYSAPIWAALLGSLVLSESVARLTRLAMVVALAGVTLVMAPALALAWQQGTAGAIGVGWYFVSLASAVVSAAALVSARAGRREVARVGARAPDGTLTLFGGFSVFGALAAAPFALPPLGTWVWPTPKLWALVVGVSAVSALAQLLMTTALAHASAAAPGVANQLSVVIASLGGVLFFDETLDAWAFAGAALIMTGVLLNVRAASPVRPR